MRKFFFGLVILGAASIILIGAASCSNQIPATPTAPAPTQTIPPPSPISPTATSLLPSPTQITPPTPTPQPMVRFAVIGDYGNAGPGLEAVAALIETWQVDLILTTGDNNYPVGAPNTIDENIGQYFHLYISPYKGNYGQGAAENRFFPTLGNHDWLWLKAKPYLDYFELPGNERYYSFSHKFVDFFALSSDWAEPDGIVPNSIQGEWLKNELSASTATWQIVYFHHAPYSSGYHGPTKHMQWPFQEWGAEVVFSGHDHHYERLDIEGMPYIVQGLSGGQIYQIHDIYPDSQVRFNENYGALLVEATPEQLWFGFYTVDGELVDEYLLKK